MNIGHTKLAEYQVDLENPDILIRPDTREYSAYEFHKGYMLIERAYELAMGTFKEKRELFGL